MLYIQGVHFAIFNIHPYARFRWIADVSECLLNTYSVEKLCF